MSAVFPARLFPRFDGASVIARPDVAPGYYKALAFAREESGQLKSGIPEWATTIILNPVDRDALFAAIAADVAPAPANE